MVTKSSGSGDRIIKIAPGDRSIAMALGIRAGILISAVVVLLAFVGLTPSFSWVPETPLLVIAVLVPIAGYVLTGALGGRRSGRLSSGVVSSAIAGVVSGFAGGLSYVLFGKPVLNIAVGVALGFVAGTVWGAIGAIVSLRNRTD
jgi:hypothetical protein